MATFTVESYRVSVTASSSDPARPRLNLVSENLGHGIRTRAVIEFENNHQGWRDNGAVGVATNVGGLNFSGINLIARMSPAMFDEVYEIVKTERPLKVNWFYKDLTPGSTSTTKWLTRITIGTEDEIPGEGNVDSDSAEALVESILAAENGTVELAHNS